MPPLYFPMALTKPPHQTNVEEEGVAVVRSAGLVAADAHRKVNHLKRKRDDESSANGQTK